MSPPSLPRVRRSLIDELLRQLRLALEDIDAVLRKTTSADMESPTTSAEKSTVRPAVRTVATIASSMPRPCRSSSR